MSKYRLILKGNNSTKGCNMVELDRIERWSSYFFQGKYHVKVDVIEKATGMNRGCLEVYLSTHLNTAGK